MKVQTQIDELLTLRASEWFEILKNPTKEQRAAFIAWLSESRRHVEEFLEVAAVDDAVGGMPTALREDLNSLIARLAPRPATLPQRARPQPWVQRVRKDTTWRAGFWSMAAGVLLTVLTWTSWSHWSRNLSTEIGEQRTLELADSSVVTLNANSRIQWHLGETRRDIELSQGEAIFKVAHDTARPFEVHTRAGIIRAVGTQFNVYARENGDTRVSVLEGRVQLTAAVASDAARPQMLSLKAGEEADLRLDGTIQRNAKASVNNAVAWRERRLAFSDALLEDMVVEFNRYNRSPRLRLQDVPLGTYRFAGIFDADDPQSLADLLDREPDLAVERGDHEIVIRRR
jgi:transmembrane sensor